MKPAICPLSVVPVRVGPSDKAEMVTQLLFGETVWIMEIRKNWTRIHCSWDNYEGWCDTKQIMPISLEAFDSATSNFASCLDWMYPLNHHDYFLPILMGASLPDFDGLKCHLGSDTFSFNGAFLPSTILEATPPLLVKIARRYLHTPYLWGGRSPFGIDCSGFTQTVYKMAGVKILRDAHQQAEQGRLLDFIALAQEGDLAFFENTKGKIAHVGILLSPKEIIHAHGKVRIDTIDHFGIFNSETQAYTHRLRMIRRFLPDLPQQLTQTVVEEVQIPDLQHKLFGI